MASPEVRHGAVLRLSGRTLAGSVLRYGDVSPEYGERFEPGAFAPVPAVPFNIQHDPDTPVLPAGGFTLTDTPEALEIRAELPERSAALQLVRRGALNGYSVEFLSRAERKQSGVRVIEHATLTGIGLVDQPSYPGSVAEIRARARLATLRGRIPVGERLECRCGPGDCTEAIFRRGSFRGIVGENLSDEGLRRDVLAVVGDYSRAIASRNRNSVRFWEGADGALEFAVDVPNSQRGRDLIETAGTVDIYARPSTDLALSKYKVKNTVADYSDAAVRALVIGATDAAKGWTAATITDIAKDVAAGLAGAALSGAIGGAQRPRRRRTWLP